MQRLARSLHPVLLATFLDCAPLVLSLSSDPSETEAQSILAVGQIVRSLYGFILQCPVSASSAKLIPCLEVKYICRWQEPMSLPRRAS